MSAGVEQESDLVGRGRRGQGTQMCHSSPQEIASYLITFEKHDEWLSCSPKTRWGGDWGGAPGGWGVPRGAPGGPPDPVSRPQNGSVILYNRKKVKYRKDGYCWKKRKDGKTTREDHMKLKVQGVEVGGGGAPKESLHLPKKTADVLQKKHPFP